MYFLILRDVSTKGINRNPGSRLRCTLGCVHRGAVLFLGARGKLGSRHVTHYVVIAGRIWSVVGDQYSGC
jgi:hypothetical protein